MIREQLFLEIFKGRKDCVGNVVGDKAKSVELSGSDDDLLRKIVQHLQGGQRLGFYNKLDDLTVNWAVVEFEDHGPGKVLDPWGYSLKLKNLLADVGITLYIELSKNEGGNSYHNWIFFEKLLEAGYVHDVLTALLKHIDPNVSPEVFPKSGDDNLGNFVWLPLFGGKDTLGLGVNEDRTVFVDDTGNLIADQWQLLENIKSTSESVYKKLESQYGIILPSDVDTEVSLKTDQLGLDKVLENCPFIKYCIDNAKDLGEPLWYAMVSNLCRLKGGKDKIHEYSEPYDGYSKAETDRKIEHALVASGPITYAKIKAEGWPGEVPEWPQSPAGWGFHLDIQGKIEYFNGIEDPIVRTRAIEKYVAETVVKQDPLRQEAILKEISGGCSLGITALRDCLEKAYISKGIDYSKPLNSILWMFDSSHEKGHATFEWLEKNGGRFYRDRENNCHLYYKDRVYRIDSNRPFKSLMFELGDISESSPGGRIIFDALANLAFERGERMDAFSWQYTDLMSNEIYLNLNNDGNELIKIAPDNVEIIKNGNNAKSILLQDSSKIQPIEYMDLGEDECREGFTKMKELVFNNLACAEADRYLYLSWALVYPLIEYFKTIPHLRVEGSSESGKSRSMDVISYLIYGKQVLKKATDASNYTDGALNPLIQLDNVETRNLTTNLEDFIITAVTGIEKEKRKQGTDKENVIEKVKTLINSSGIEGFNKNEMINRTLVINFDRFKYGNPEWNELIYVEIAKTRNLMMSVIFQMISKILKRISDGELNSIVKDISAKYGNHSKSRANSYLACMTMVAEKLIEGFNDTITMDQLVEKWIDTQNTLSKETSRGTNPIIQLLDSLIKDFEMEFERQTARCSAEEFVSPYPTEIAQDLERWIVIGTSNELCTAFAILAKRTGIKNPFSNAHQLAARLKDSETILADNDWKVKIEDAGSRKRIYRLTRCESVKVQNRLSQGLSQ